MAEWLGSGLQNRVHGFDSRRCLQHLFCMNKPTIGIEIELPWRSVLSRVDPEAGLILANSSGFYTLPDIEKARVQKGFDAVDEEYRDLVDSFFGEDIEKQHDGYREFAFRPKADHTEISEVAEGLYEAGVLVDGESYPLHVTLGGVAAKNSSWLILMAAELSGSATAKRLIEVNTWSQKGKAGVRERGAREMKLGSKVGVEMRSLEALSLDQLSRVVAITQAAGSTLLNKLAGDQPAITRWTELYRHLMESVEQKDIDARVRWRNPQVDHTPWLALGAAIDDTLWQQTTEAGIQAILRG